MQTQTFIGKTNLLHRVLSHKVNRLMARLAAGDKPDVLERRWLFTGPPGVGKTSLATALVGEILGQPWSLESSNPSVDYLNGSGLTIDVVRAWTEEAHYRPMFGEVSIKFVDEIDAISNAALTDIRTYLDRLAPHRIFIATTNRAVEQLQPQLQSRFQIFEFSPVQTSEIADYLVTKYGLDVPTARRIATGAAGNGRAAELDAVTELDVRACRAIAA